MCTEFNFIFTYIVGKVARGMLGDWMSRKHEEYGQSVHGQGLAQGFYKKTLW